MSGFGLDMDETIAGPTRRSLRDPFHRDLDDVRRTIARRSAALTEDIRRATEVVLARDLDAAAQMAAADHDAECLGVERRCHRLLALEAPVASDLREIVAALRIVAEVQRSADLVVNVARAACRLPGPALPAPIRDLIRRMAAHASLLFREASESYLLRDPVRAAAIPDLDDVLDELQRRLVGAIFDATDGGDGIDLPTAVQLAMLARFYERIGDHAVTIGGRVTFLVTGTLLRPCG